MSMKGYVCIPDYSAEALHILRPMLDLEVRPRGDRPDEKELARLASENDALIIGVKEKMTAKVYRSSRRLRVIGTLSIGLDHISPEFFADEKFLIINTPLSNVTSVAEHTYALILGVFKRLVEGHHASITCQGRKGLSSFPIEVEGKVLGVIGAGRIGTKVMRMARFLGLGVICFTYHPDQHAELKEEGVTFLPLEDVLRDADIISLHLPLTDESRCILSESRIEHLSRSPVLINTARSELTDMPAVARALASGQIAGLGMDDIDDRDVARIRKCHNVVLTPHIGGCTNEAMARMDIELAEQLAKRLQICQDV